MGFERNFMTGASMIHAFIGFFLFAQGVTYGDITFLVMSVGFIVVSAYFFTFRMEWDLLYSLSKKGGSVKRQRSSKEAN